MRPSPAVYYLRALEIPTPRWTTYLAAKRGLPVPDDLAGDAAGARLFLAHLVHAACGQAREAGAE